MFNIFNWRWLKQLGFNKLFNAGDTLADKTDNVWDDEVIAVAREDFKPIITENGAIPRCSRTFLLHFLQISVEYAKKHKTCDWLWDWLREAQKILSEIEL